MGRVIGMSIPALVLVVIGACRAEPATEPASSGSSFPRTVQTHSGAVHMPARPQRIVSMSATATETLFAIGAGQQVVAVDDQSDFPDEAPITDLSAYEPNVEAVLSYDPDLVVFSGDPGDLGPALRSADVPALLQPSAADLSDVYEQIAVLGQATGNEERADELVTSMREQLEQIVETAPVERPASTFYHELDDTYFSVTSATFIGQIYDLFGLENIANDASDSGGGGYPQLSAEYILDADPDLIFLADGECCQQSARTVQRRPGWEGITAVRNDAIVQLDEDVASRWGPRVVTFAQTIADELAASGQAAA